MGGDRGGAAQSEKIGLKISETEPKQIDRLLTNNFEALVWFRRAWTVYEQRAGTQSSYTEAQHLAQRALELEDFEVAIHHRGGDQVFIHRVPSLERHHRENLSGKMNVAVPEAGADGFWCEFSNDAVPEAGAPFHAWPFAALERPSALRFSSAPRKGAARLERRPPARRRSIASKARLD